MSDSASLDDLMARLRDRDNAAAAQVFRRFARRLLALAAARVTGNLRRKVEPEDIVQSVFKSFFRRCDDDLVFPDWDGLWAYLVVLTARKCGRNIRFHTQARRDHRRERGPSPPADDAGSGWEFEGDEPTPQEAAVAADLAEQLMRGLDERGRLVVEWRLQGQEVAAIAAQLGCSERMVYRVLKLARQRLERLAAAGTEE